MRRVPGSPLSRKGLHSRRPRLRRQSSRFLWISLLLLPISRSLVFAAGSLEESRMEQKIMRIILEFRGRLGITEPVTVSIVSGNSRLASAACSSAKRQEYEISFDAGFLRTLDDHELVAAVAHEMGHIWIFTHFPYLQTETLANQHALKLVSPNDLRRVYEKMWKWKGEGQGDLSIFLGKDTDNQHANGRLPQGN